MIFDRISFRLTHRRDSELFDRFNTEGKLSLTGYELLPIHPDIVTERTFQDKVWVEKRTAIAGSHLQDVFYEARDKGDILPPEKYARFSEMMTQKYNGEIRPQSYEMYVEGMKTPEYLLFLEFDKVGAQQLAVVTSANINRKLAVVVKDYVLAAPIIREAILGGCVQLIFGGKHEGADRLVRILKG